MNKHFAMKMIQAKQLQYQALKEIMPENMLNRLQAMEYELLEFGKEYFMTMVYNPTNNEKNTSSETKSCIRKVTIE